MTGSVAWISIAPVKGLGLVSREEVELESFGARDNRRFYLVDEVGRMVNGKVAQTLLAVAPSTTTPAGSSRSGSLTAGSSRVRSPSRSR